jgi:hypothetical protein
VIVSVCVCVCVCACVSVTYARANICDCVCLRERVYECGVCVRTGVCGLYVYVWVCMCVDQCFWLMHPS